jgi:hypothetical protein
MHTFPNLFYFILRMSQGLFMLFPYLSLLSGSAIAQAISSRLLTATARVRARTRSCGICGGQSDTGTGFLRVLRFPLPILIPPSAPRSSSIIRGWCNRPISGRRTKWTQSHPTPRNFKKKTEPTCLRCLARSAVHFHCAYVTP